jgi:hypothetical protein
MRRVLLTLTEAQAAWLRGAVRSHREDMSIAGMLSAADERMANDILTQLSQPAKKVS